MNTSPLRTIRSFVKREGRLTKGQQRALQELLPQFSLQIENGILDQQKIFGRMAPLIVEIGFGMGASLAQMAAENPQQDYLGIEVHRPGVGSLLLQIEELALKNIRIYNDDAIIVLNQCISDHSLTGVQLFFPDPWPKKRHHKRRIVQPEFVQLIRQKLQNQGWFHLATDWEPYAQHMQEILQQAPGFRNCTEDFLSKMTRPSTKFEKRGRKLGHGVWDLVYQAV